MPHRLLSASSLGLSVGLAFACRTGPGRFPERSSEAPLEQASYPVGSPEASRGGYLGSDACSPCHYEIYEVWRSTSHSTTVRSGSEAARAGEPLPQAMRSWSAVSYVVGSGERLTYVDVSGRVLAESYHHRIGDWDRFPSMSITECRPCHFTGSAAGPDPQEDQPASSRRWAERGIGCEACHGPGKRHAASQAANDIQVDYSSRTCGACHTAVGRVLPEDEWHSTHDLVQNWNRDPHVTGGRFQSISAFCARCHAPDQGFIAGSMESAERPVPSETRRNVTCIGCHNPHEASPLGPIGEKRDAATSRPASAAKLHAYSGDDSDFTTVDFQTVEDTEALCTHCHSGADRIDLDHANASCTDCHTLFRANHGRESRLDHDANRPGLSCRNCHQNADELITILFSDPMFLEPKNVHDLRDLPEAAVRKYGFRYPAIPEAGRFVAIGAETETPPADGSGTSPDKQGKAPERIDEYLTLALSHADGGSRDAAAQLLDRALRLDTTWLLVALVGARERSAVADAADLRVLQERRAVLEASAPGEETRRWIAGYLALRRDDFEEAEEAFADAERAAPDEPSLSFYRGLSSLAAERYEEAAQRLADALEREPEHHAARVALGLTRLRQNRFLHARKELERAMAMAPEDPIAPYFLGQGFLQQNDAASASVSLETAVSLSPALLDARLDLARSYRLSGEPGSSVRVYRELIRDEPALFEAHFELAKLYKYASDQSAFRLLHERERARPRAMPEGAWRRRLDALDERSLAYGRLALAQFGAALTARPWDLESKRQVSEALRRLGELDKAEAYYRWLGENALEDGLALYRLGTILVQRRHYREAIPVLRRAILAAPEDGDARVALGLALLESGRVKQAIEALEEARERQPFNPALFTNLGAAYASAGQRKLARQALERSLELATFPLPRVHLTHTNLALLDLAEGDREGAVKSLETALHAYPDYEYARSLLDAIAESRETPKARAYVLSDLLERFGEVTTVSFE